MVHYTDLSSFKNRSPPFRCSCSPPLSREAYRQLQLVCILYIFEMYKIIDCTKLLTFKEFILVCNVVVTTHCQYKNYINYTVAILRVVISSKHTGILNFR